MNRGAGVTLILLLALCGCTREHAYDELAETFRVPDEIAPISVLVLTTTHGYRHGPAIEATQALLAALNGTTEFRFDVTEKLTDLNPENLGRYDALFFANSTLRLAPEEPEGLTAEQRQAIIGFMDAGGGFAGAHSALDACYQWDEYRTLVGGGLFLAHPWTQVVRILPEGGPLPTTSHIHPGLVIRDEIYLLDANPRANARILLSLDNSSVDLAKKPDGVEHDDFPISWTREHRRGRVFITKLGHFPEVWQNPAFVQHLLQGLRYAAGARQHRSLQTTE